jgi:hypothetical protein
MIANPFGMPSWCLERVRFCGTEKERVTERERHKSFRPTIVYSTCHTHTQQHFSYRLIYLWKFTLKCRRSRLRWSSFVRAKVVVVSSGLVQMWNCVWLRDAIASTNGSGFWYIFCPGRKPDSGPTRPWWKVAGSQFGGAASESNPKHVASCTRFREACSCANSGWPSLRVFCVIFLQLSLTLDSAHCTRFLHVLFPCS